MDIASKMLTYSQTADMDTQKPIPYLVRRDKNGQHLFLIAINHLFHPDAPQYKKLPLLWREFLDLTNAKNCIVLVEGGLRPVCGSDEMAIMQQGEQGLVTNWASKVGIPVASAEPPDYAESKILLKTFTKDEVMYYYFARQIPQWHKIRPRPDFEQYIATVFERYKKALGWKDFDFSLENLKLIHEKLFHIPFNKEDSDFFYDQHNPTIGKTVIQKVAAACSSERNVHIAKEIIRYWSEGKSIFSAFGSSHVYRLEPIIQELGGE